MTILIRWSVQDRHSLQYGYDDGDDDEKGKVIYLDDVGAPEGDNLHDGLVLLERKFRLSLGGSLLILPASSHDPLARPSQTSFKKM